MRINPLPRPLRSESLSLQVLGVIVVQVRPEEALAGRPGVRLVATLGMRAGSDTLPALLRGLPGPEIGEIGVVGVDDFSIRRGSSYATIIVDMATGEAIDVLRPLATLSCDGYCGWPVKAVDAFDAFEPVPEPLVLCDKWYSIF